VVASFFLSFPFWDICLKKKKQKQLYWSMKRLMLNWTRTVATCVFSFASIYTSMGVRTSTVLCCFVDLDFHIWRKKKEKKKKKKKEMSLSPQHDVILLDACVCDREKIWYFLSVCFLVCWSVCLFVFLSVFVPQC
jgi:hypothetical protein